MSHPDPLFDPDNALEDDEMATNYSDYNYDYHDSFYGEDSANYHPDADHEISTNFDDDGDMDDTYDDSMDGDHESALASAGWGTDEDYGYFGEDVDYREDFHCDDGYGYYDDGE
jgi:hypothetical protein